MSAHALLARAILEHDRRAVADGPGGITSKRTHDPHAMSEKTCSGELETSSARSGADLEQDDEISLEQLPRVGETRANSLREAGFETARDLADADVEEVAQSLPVHGETTAKRLTGSARGHVYPLSERTTDESAETDAEEDPFVYPADEGDSDASADEEASEERRVVVLAGENAWDDRGTSEVGSLIDRAFDRFDLDADRVGVPTGSNGGDVVRDVFRSSRSEVLDEVGSLQTFDPEWPDEDEQEEMDSDDWRAVFEERDQLMMMWATDVVIVENGDYVGSTLNAVGQRTRPTVHEYIDENETLVADN